MPRTSRVISQQRRKTPSCPDTPKPSIMFCVSRKGTISGAASVSPLRTGYGNGLFTSWLQQNESAAVEMSSFKIPQRIHEPVK